MDLSTVHSSLLPAKWDGDGILCTAGVNTAVDRRIIGYRKPTVNISTNGRFPAPRVAADMEKVVDMAIEHFTRRGFEHLAYYVCTGNATEMAKLEVFRRAVGPAPLK